jgi:predicted outer membrane protein
MLYRLRATIAILAASATMAACDRDKPAAQRTARPDSASGEVAQYALMKNQIGWLSDSNIVALAGQVNSDAQEIARLQTQTWASEPFRLFAAEILRDHARLQYSIDSLASARRLPAQAPAVAAEMKAPYDSMLATQIGLPLNERESQFLGVIVKVHDRSALDFGALAGNATDPDLRALLLTRAVIMEQAHAARAQLIAGAVARNDSVRADSTRADSTRRRRGGRR